MLDARKLEEVTTYVGNALTALDDPDGIPDLDPEDPFAQIDYAKTELIHAMNILHPTEEQEWARRAEQR